MKTSRDLHGFMTITRYFNKFNEYSQYFSNVYFENTTFLHCLFYSLNLISVFMKMLHYDMLFIICLGFSHHFLWKLLRSYMTFTSELVIYVRVLMKTFSFFAFFSELKVFENIFMKIPCIYKSYNEKLSVLTWSFVDIPKIFLKTVLCL